MVASSLMPLNFSIYHIYWALVDPFFLFWLIKKEEWSKWASDLRKFCITLSHYTRYFLNSNSLVQLLEKSDPMSSLYCTALVLMFWCSLQVLQQLDVFASDDVDSAAEALNDVSFKALCSLTFSPARCDACLFFKPAVHSCLIPFWFWALLEKLKFQARYRVLVANSWFVWSYDRCPSRNSTWLLKWLHRVNTVGQQKPSILAKKRLISHISMIAFKILFDIECVVSSNLGRNHGFPVSPLHLTVDCWFAHTPLMGFFYSWVIQRFLLAIHARCVRAHSWTSFAF